MAQDQDTVSDSWAERELDFEDIQGQQQLSAQRNRVEASVNGVPEVGMRVKITQHSSVLGTKVYGLVHKVCWGKYEDKLACLLVVRFRFTSGAGLFRLRKAIIEICFENHPLIGGSRTLLSGREDPVLRIYSPRQIYGIPTGVEHEVVWSVAAQCSVSAGPVSAGPEVSRASTTRYTTQAALEIAGMDEADRDKDLPNIAIFEIDENTKTSKGIPRELYFGTVVQCDGAIQADVKTNIGDRSALPWTRDDPIVLKPGKGHGDIPAAIPRDFDRLSDDDWKMLVPYQEERSNSVQGRTT